MASESSRPLPSFYAKPAPAEPPDWDLEFLQMYSISSFKANPRGYQAYIDSVAYDLAGILDRPIPFYLEENPDKPHGYVLGTSGSGKSELLKLLIHTYISNNNYGSVVVMDPTSDFVSQIARWKEFNKESERLIYFRPTLAKGMTPIINPFEIYGVSATDYSEEALDVKRVVAQELVEAIGHIVDQPSAPMRTLLMNCVLVLLDKEGATLGDLNNFMMKETNNELVQFAGSLSHHEHVASYFGRKDGGFNNPANKMTKDAINRRLDELLSIGTFKKLTCGKSTFHLEEAVNDKKVILFDLGRGAIGPKEGSDFGRLVIAILLGMAYRRANLPEAERIPCSLIVDECQNFVTKSMTDILNEARKYRFFITLAQLVAGQFMPIELRDSLLQNTNLQVVGGTTRSGAKRNADLVGVETSDIETLETGEFYTKPNRSLPAVKFKTRTELLKYKNSVTKEIWNLTRFQQIEKYYRGTLKKAEIDFEEEPDTGSQKWD